MSVLMKARHTEVEIKTGDQVLKFRDVPLSKLRPFLVSLKDYAEETIPWRKAAGKRIKASGGESAHMVRVSREMAKMTQVELAGLLKMPQANVSQIETGKRPVGKVLAKRLAKVFKVDYRVFL
jgi:DNA-binding XRE family transcriptional regulator